MLLPAPVAPAPFRFALTVGPVLAVTLALWLRPRLFAFLDTLDSRWLIGAHAIRFPVGLAFVVLGRDGQLPWEFAQPAGVGDMIAGAGAVVLVLAWPWLTKRAAAGAPLLIWNVVGCWIFSTSSGSSTISI